jgi:hypothetical protein
VIVHIINKKTYDLWVSIMVFCGTWNNISVISWWQVWLADETGVSGENNRPVASYWNLKLYRTHLAVSRIRTHNPYDIKLWYKIK